MIGAAGRLYISGTRDGVAAARSAVGELLAGVQGREHG
jgi:hypothetical protein